MANKVSILVNALLKTDKEDMQKQLDTLAKKAKLNIIPRINFDTNSIAKFKADVDRLAKKVKLNIDVAIDKNIINQKIQDATKEIQDAVKNASKISGNVGESLVLSPDTDKNLDEFSQKYTRAAGESYKLTQETKKFVNELGQSVKLVYDLDKETGDITKSTQTVTDNYKKQRLEIEKINAEQSKYWSQRVKETVSTMTQKPDGLKKLSQYYKELEVNTAKATAEQKKLTDALTLFKQKMLGGDGFRGELDIFADKQKSRLTEDMKNSLTRIRTNIMALNKDTPNLQYKIKQLSGQFAILNKEAQKSSSVLMNALENAGKFLRFYLVGGVLVGFVRSIRDTISYINELDKNLTNIRIVTGETTDEMTRLARSYNELAKQLGATTNQLLTGATEWFRQGKNASEVQKLLIATMVESKLAGIESAQATEYLTSVLNGYQMEAENAISVVDQLVAVDNAAATSVAELSIALQRSSNSAAQAGVGLSRLVGYVGAVSSVTRKSASTIGESFKTIFARMQDLQAGKLDEEGVSFSNVESALSRIGVALRKDKDTFRDMGDVLDDISAKWNTLTNVEQSNISKAIAGVRQRENFLVLMNNYNEALRLEQIALDSSGLAMDRYNIYLESTEAKWAKFTATLEGLYTKIISSDGIKKIITGGTEFLNIIDRIISTLGGLNTTLILLTSGVMIKFVAQMYNIEKGASIATTAVATLDSGIKGLLASLTALIKNPVTWVIAAIGAVTIGSFALINHNKKLQESIERIDKATKNYNSSLKELNNTLDQTKISDAAQKLEELKEAIDYEDKIEQIKQLKKEIAGLEKTESLLDVFYEKVFGENTFMTEAGRKRKEIDELNKSIDVVSKAQKKYNKVAELTKILDLDSTKNKFKLVSSNKQLASENKKLADSYKIVYDKLVKGVELTEEETKLNKKLIAQYPEHVELINNKTGALGVSHEALKSSIELQNKLAEVEFQEYKFSIKANADKINSEIDVAQAKMVSVQNQINAIDELIKKEKQLSLADPRKREIAKAMGFDEEKFLGQLEKERETRGKQLIQEQKRLDKLRIAAEAYSNILEADSYEDFAKIFSGNEKYEIDGNADNISKYSSRLSEFANQLSQISEIESQLAQIRGLRDLVTESERIPLIEKEIELQNELIKLNEELKKAQIASRDKTAYELLDKFGNVVALSSDLKTLTINWEEFNKVSNASTKDQKSQKEILEELINKYNDLNSSINSTSTAILNAQKAIQELNKNIESYADDVIDLYKEIYKTQKEVQLKLIDEAIEKEDERHEKQIENLDEELQKYEEIINAKLKLIDEEADEDDYQKELTKLQKERNEIRDKINVLSLDDSIEAKAQLAELNKQLAEQEEDIAELQQKHTIDLRKKNLQNQLETYKKDINAKKEAENNKYKAEKDALDKSKKYWTDYYDNLINSGRKFASIKQQIVAGTLKSIQSDFASFADYIKSYSEIIGESISENLNDKIVEVQGILNNVSKVKKGSSSNTNEHQKYLDDSGEFGGSANYIKSQQERYRKAVEEGNFDLIRRLIEDSQRVGYKLYHSGGIVGEKMTNPKAEQWAKLLLNKEVVLNEQHLLNIPKLFGNMLAKIMPIQPAMAGVGTTNINVHIDRLNANDRNSVDVFFTAIANKMKKNGI